MGTAIQTESNAHSHLNQSNQLTDCLGYNFVFQQVTHIQKKILKINEKKN